MSLDLHDKIAFLGRSIGLGTILIKSFLIMVLINQSITITGNGWRYYT